MTPRALCLAGPTASGKSAAALAIAAALPVEIVSVDSAQVYRGMDIGTAKPSAAERAALPHHLIDIVEPCDAYSAARFVADVDRLLPQIEARGHVPLLVGGTMLYFKALFDGLDVLPAADAAVRAQIDALAAERGWPAVHAELARVDPASAARLGPNDRQRVQRALEVFRIGGRPLSQLQRRSTAPLSTGEARDGSCWREHYPLLALQPTDRAWLHTRIAERFHAMLDAGLIDEVRGLRERGDLNAALPSMRSVGYRQVWAMLDAADARDGAQDGAFDTTAERTRLAERGIAATRQLAKRQLTWLRGMPARAVLACDAPDVAARAVDWAQRAAHAAG